MWRNPSLPCNGARSTRCAGQAIRSCSTDDLIADIRTEMLGRPRRVRRAARAGPGHLRHQTPHRIGARLRGAPPRARRVRVEARHREGPGGAPGDPADAVVAGRAVPHRPRRRGDGPAGRRGPRHRHLDGGLGPADEADLRGMSVERVTKFVESFPPLDRRSNPVTEAAAQWPLDGPILLRARVDLMIGRPSGRREPQGDHRPQDRSAERPPPPGPRVSTR